MAPDSAYSRNNLYSCNMDNRISMNVSSIKFELEAEQQSARTAGIFSFLCTSNRVRRNFLSAFVNMECRAQALL